MDLPQPIKAWAETAVGGTLLAATRLPGGGSNQAWLVSFQPNHVEIGTGTPIELFLRIDAGAQSTRGDAGKLQREHDVYRSLADTTLPVARAVAVSPEGDALLLTRVEGDASFATIADPETQRDIALQFMVHLAELHALDLTNRSFPGFQPTMTLADCALAQVDWIKRIVASGGGTPEPLLALATRWLTSNVPKNIAAHESRPVLVQGDTGPGNFLHNGTHVTAIVDWELAHPGDPMDDLAWVSLRSVQEPFGDQRELFAAYEAASGNRIDAGRIRYYRVMAEAKILAMSHNSPPAARAESGRDAGAAVIFGHLHRRLCLEALGDAMGEPIPRFNVPASSQPTDAQLLIDSVLDSLRTDIVPRISDPFASRRAKSSARVLKYVSNLIANQATFEALELEQLNEVLGTPSATVAAARNVLSDAIATAHIRDSPAFRAVAIRVSLDQILTREASGALAERHYQPF